MQNVKDTLKNTLRGGPVFNGQKWYNFLRVASAKVCILCFCSPLMLSGCDGSPASCTSDCRCSLMILRLCKSRLAIHKAKKIELSTAHKKVSEHSASHYS